MTSQEQKLRTAFKEIILTDVKTSRKNQYPLASPLRNTPDRPNYKFSTINFRSPLKQQEIHDYNRIKTELKKGIELAKQNISLNQSGHWISFQEYNILDQEYKYETQRLLFQIEKLHQTICEVQQLKNLEIQKIKEQHQKISLLNVSNLKQIHSAQVDMLETQLRKTKQLMNDKAIQYENVIKRQQRQIKHLNNEVTRLNEEVKMSIEQRNTEQQGQSKIWEQKLRTAKQQYQKKQNQLQESQAREVNKLRRTLQQNERRLNEYMGEKQETEVHVQKLKFDIQNRRLQEIQRIDGLEEESRLKYNTFKQKLLQQYHSIIQETTRNSEIKHQLLEAEIAKLKTLLKLKTQDREKLIQLNQDRLNFLTLLNEQLQSENQELKTKLFSLRQDHLQEFEITKLKMAALHQNDITSLVETYDLKLQNLIEKNNQSEETIRRLRQNLYDQTSHRYQLRKKYSTQFSKLNEKVIKLRSGMTAMETGLREKLENERSMLLLTSRNLIKDVQSKTSGSKFIELELRKIQQLYAEHERQYKQANDLIDEKVKMAEEQLDRLTRHVLDEKNRHQETEQTYKEILRTKDQTIEKLSKQLQQIQHPQFDNSKELQTIEELKNEIHQKRLQNAKLKDHSELLEKKISLMKAEVDQYQIQHSITQEEAKKQFERISKQNMRNFSQFYQDRISTLEKQKAELKELISCKEEKITSLVQKYQQLQKTMRNTLAKIKKKTELESKVMSLGMDNNLIKNMAEIVRNELDRPGQDHF